MNPIFYIDFYKVGHVAQYPEGITQVYSNWTPRSTRIEDSDGVVFFGLQYFLKKYLIDEFNVNFFRKPWIDVEAAYIEVIGHTLGVAHPKTDHIKALHKLGYLPLKFWAVPEGTVTPIGVPQLVVTNTVGEFFWLVNYIESLMSNILWKPCTSATTARRFRKLFEKWARAYGHSDTSFVTWQGHDFSFRGMSGLEDAILSGMGHLVNFSGTDTLPAILAARSYYTAPLSCGGSVPATEHSVMCAGGQEGEFETFERLLDIYPSGILSVVSDTWDLWRVLTDYIPRLRDRLLARDGKLVIRPDSGDPVKIMIGDPEAEPGSPQYKGTVQLLAEAMGTKNGMINNAGAIYGDGISLERADAILNGVVNKWKLSPYNVVFGIGSYTYEYVTRDTYGFAMKATAVVKDNKLMPIFKKPVTDDGGKFSHYGIPVPCYTTKGIVTKQNARPDELDKWPSVFQVAFNNGYMERPTNFDKIRKLVRLCE